MAVQPWVGITIVTFNSARFIRQCLEHVFEQDYPALSVVVVDNASSDETAEIYGILRSAPRWCTTATMSGSRQARIRQ